MDLDDRGAITAAVAFDNLLGLIIKIDMLPKDALLWLHGAIEAEINRNRDPDSVLDFFEAAQVLVGDAIDAEDG